jgi:UDP-glucose 4-epimerase
MNSIENNVIGTVELLRQAVAAGVRRVVYAGSSSAYGNQMVKEKGEGLLPEVLSPYAASKLSAEFILQSFGECYGLETVTTRYFNVFGERQDPSSQYSGVIAKFSCAMLRGESPVIFGDGHQSRDFTYVKNVVDGNILAADAAAERVSGHVFNIANGGNVSLLELVGELNGLLGSNLPICFSDARTGDVRHSTADIKKAMAMLGYIPSTDFRDGLKATVEWYRNMGKQKQPALVGQSRIA